MRISIKTRIVLAIGIPLAIMWAGMVVYEYGVGRREAVAGVKAYLTELTARQAAQLDIELSKAEQLTDTLAALVALNPDLSRDQIEPWLAKLLRDNAEAFAIGVALEHDILSTDGAKMALYCHQCSESGVRFAALDDGDEANSFHEWFRRQSVEGRPFWTEPYTDDLAGGRMMCTYVAPLLADGKFRGAVAVDVLTEHLLDDILATRNQGEYCTLISRKGVFLSHPDASRFMQPAEFKPLDEPGSRGLSDSSGRHGVQPTGVRRVLDDHSGVPAWVVRVPIPSADWTLAAVLPESEVLAPIHARLARSLWVLAACGVLMLGVVWCVSARVTRPIRRLTRAAESLAAGDLETHVAGASNSDEIGQLARTFNMMVGDLRAHIEHRLRDEAAKRQMEGELRAARRIQAALLPEAFPDRPDRPFTLRAVNEPAKRVAGDFFDFFMVDRRTLAVVMADVSGKGIPAAIYMAVTRTTLRLFASPDKTPGEVVGEVNRSLASENENEMFVTLFLGYYNVESGELTYANAGHVPPYILRESGRLDLLEPTGPLVAPFADAVFEDARCRLEPNDQLILYTDGVTEAMSADGTFYGEERFKAFLQLRDNHQKEDACQGILDEIRQFSRGELSDDATLLVLKRIDPVEPTQDVATERGRSRLLSHVEDPEVGDLTFQPETSPR